MSTGVNKIILASQSPRRKQLLEWAELHFDIIIEPVEEDFPAGMPVSEVPVHIARNKMLAVTGSAAFAKYDAANTVIIAADTVVVLNNRIIGKPVDREEALSILGSLSGNTHQVVTGVVMRKGEKEVAFADITDVSFHPLTEEQITHYVDRYQPYDKAGAYGIHEWIGVTGIKHIDGDFYSVMGLPISRVVQALQSF